jgi:hypothetical protein
MCQGYYLLLYDVWLHFSKAALKSLIMKESMPADAQVSSFCA